MLLDVGVAPRNDKMPIVFFRAVIDCFGKCMGAGVAIQKEIICPLPAVSVLVDMILPVRRFAHGCVALMLEWLVVGVKSPFG